MAKNTVKRQTTEDLFNTLSQSAEKVEQKPKGRKKDRPQIELSEKEQKAFEAFCSADVLFKMAEGKKEATKSVILPVLRRKLLNKWIAEGHKTDNPVVQTESARANFVVRDILKIELSEDENGASIKDRLAEVGFNQEEVEEIFTRELTERVEINFRGLNELRRGNPAEQKAVNKLLKLILDNFSTEEQRLLLRKETKVEVQDGFLNRAVQHANSLEKLDGLLNIIAPQWVLSHMTYSGKDLKQAVAELTGGDLPSTEELSVQAEEFYSVDRKWKAVVRGAEASLYKCVDDKETLLGVKKCKGGIDHARMTCKKWLKDEKYRTESIAGFISQQ